MPRQFWCETLAWATAAGTPVANSTTETILQPNMDIPAGTMADGRVLRLSASGAYGTITGSNSLILSLRWGGVGGVVISKSFSNLLLASMGGGASMTALWFLEAVIQTRSNGLTGTLFTNGIATFFTGTLTTQGTATNMGSTIVVASGSTGGTTPVAVTCDLTVNTALSLTAKWDVANAANSIRCDTLLLESSN